MRNCIEYVLQEQKIKGGFVTMTGPAPEDINWDTVYNAFLEEKQLWGKDEGRMYAHNVISFHKDENITPAQAFEIAKEVVAETFPNHQTLISVHQDKDHIHAHLVTNTVSFGDGHKLHMTKYDLENMKQLTNQLCFDRGLSIAHKGEHFDGTKIEESAIISWSKDKYQALIKKINTVLMDCVASVLSAKSEATSKDEFIQKLSQNGWQTIWEERKKHITFINIDGKKIRDSNISKNYNVDISKDSLQRVFELNATQQLSPDEYNELLKQLHSHKDAQAEIQTRIESFEQYIRCCPCNDPGLKPALEKLDLLQKDISKLDESIDSINYKINHVKVKQPAYELIGEEQQTISGLKMHF
jgi:hypothetical protein